jgi:hypothetical protein
MISSVLLLFFVMVIASSSAFTVVPATRCSLAPSTMALHLKLSLDPVVLAAGGVAVVGGLGAMMISQKLNKLDTELFTPAPPVAAPASTAKGTTVDLSIPYDAAARLAYEQAGSPGDYIAFKEKYEADAVTAVKAKRK